MWSMRIWTWKGVEHYLPSNGYNVYEETPAKDSFYEMKGLNIICDKLWGGKYALNTVINNHMYQFQSGNENLHHHQFGSLFLKENRVSFM